MNILFICTGNTCRSPMAEGYLNSLKLPNLEVLSRGLAAQGDHVSKNAAIAMEEKGINLNNHISAPVTDADLAWADKICRPLTTPCCGFILKKANCSYWVTEFATPTAGI